MSPAHGEIRSVDHVIWRFEPRPADAQNAGAPRWVCEALPQLCVEKFPDDDYSTPEEPLLHGWCVIYAPLDDEPGRYESMKGITPDRTALNLAVELAREIAKEWLALSASMYNKADEAAIRLGLQEEAGK